MIKTICNRCGKEFSTQYFLVKIIVLERHDFLLPTPDKKKAIQTQIEQREGHICSKCWTEISKDFKHPI
jgi:DNA-directed RNA polymerase subunit RPC12/RpoP